MGTVTVSTAAAEAEKWHVFLAIVAVGVAFVFFLTALGALFTATQWATGAVAIGSLIGAIGLIVAAHHAGADYQAAARAAFVDQVHMVLADEGLNWRFDQEQTVTALVDGAVRECVLGAGAQRGDEMSVPVTCAGAALVD